MSVTSAIVSRMRRFTRRIQKDDDGVVSMEFVLWAPLFFMVFVASVEAGFLLVKKVMIERGVDVAVRDIRLGKVTDRDIIKQTICDRTLLVSDCMNVLTLEMRAVDTSTWGPLNNIATCVDRGGDLNPPVTYRPGAANELMLVRACAVVDPVFPSSWLALKLPRDQGNKGGYWIIASSAFVNEP